MDIDVKNAYLKVVNNSDESIKNKFINDIYKFICYISNTGAKERFDSFAGTYIQKKVEIMDSEGALFIPESLIASDGKKADDIISFFIVLGKYYILSRFDKKEIDKQNYLNFVKHINRPIQRENQAKIIQESIQQKEEKRVVPKEEEKIDEIENEEPEESVEELMAKLNSLIGLDAVKKEVDQIINLICLQKKGEEFGEKHVPLSLHLVFYGNPGTGKTTVARLLAKIYKALGVLSKGQLVEVDRGGLVAGFVGQTAEKTQKVIDEAMGGILFIDEAYALTHGKGDNDFGQEAVDTLLKSMEDHREDFIVIVAGYPDLMKEFIASNPGLKSRFNQYIEFEDYKPEELKEIFMLHCNNQNLIIEDDCKDYLFEYFSELYTNRSDDYANGRDVRNYFENVVKMRANRLKPILASITPEQYRTIVLDDLRNAANVKNSNW